MLKPVMLKQGAGRFVRGLLLRSFMVVVLHHLAHERAYTGAHGVHRLGRRGRNPLREVLGVLEAEAPDPTATHPIANMTRTSVPEIRWMSPVVWHHFRPGRERRVCPRASPMLSFILISCHDASQKARDRRLVLRTDSADIRERSHVIRRACRDCQRNVEDSRLRACRPTASGLTLPRGVSGARSGAAQPRSAGPSAVDHMDGARRVARLVAREVDRERCDLVGGAEAAHRLARDERGARGGGVCVLVDAAL